MTLCECMDEAVVLNKACRHLVLAHLNSQIAEEKDFNVVLKYIGYFLEEFDENSLYPHAPDGTPWSQRIENHIKKPQLEDLQRKVETRTLAEEDFNLLCRLQEVQSSRISCSLETER